MSGHHIFYLMFQRGTYLIRIIGIYNHDYGLFKEGLLDFFRLFFQSQQTALSGNQSQIHQGIHGLRYIIFFSSSKADSDMLRNFLNDSEWVAGD